MVYDARPAAGRKDRVQLPAVLPKLRPRVSGEGTHGQVPGRQRHPADNYELTCSGQGSGNSGLCAGSLLQ